MNREELKKKIGEDLCQFCPWANLFPCVFGRNCCDEALDNFMKENEQYFNDLED